MAAKKDGTEITGTNAADRPDIETKKETLPYPASGAPEEVGQPAKPPVADEPTD